MKNQQVVLCGECSRCNNPDWTICCSNLQNQDEAMFHDGNSDHSVSGRVLSEGWRRHHVCSLSKSVENPVV